MQYYGIFFVKNNGKTLELFIKCFNIADRWEAILDLMVVICRPKGEKYDFKEQAHKQRKNFFRKLNMDILIIVAFFLLQLNDTLKDNLLIYSLQQQVKQAEAEKLQKVMDGLY